MSHYEIKRFGDVVDINPPVKLNKGVIYDFVSMEALNPGFKYVYPNQKREAGGGTKFREKDTLFARITPCLEHGKICQVKDLNGGIGFGSTEFFVFRGKDGVTDNDFVYYLSLTESIRKTAIASMVGASGRQRAQLKVVENYELPIPPLETQKKIASILSSFDDLIENNLKRIKLLEEAAELIYREWFVNLRFPGHEKVKIVDGVPEGWEKSKVGLILKTLPKSYKVTTDKYLEEGILPVIDQSTKYIAGYINDFSLKVPVEPPVIVFGDHTRIVKYIDFDFVRGADGTQLIVSNSNRLPQVLFYHHLKNINLSNYHYSRHFKFLKEESIFIPDSVVAQNFEDLSSPLYKQMNILRQTNIVLSKVRDLLLPKLMDGSLNLSHFNI